MNQSPEVRYAKAGERSIAYQLLGDGPGAIVVVAGILNHLEANGCTTEFSSLVRRLSRFARIAFFDKHGTGLSDRSPSPAGRSVALCAEDALAVMNAAGIERAAVLGSADGGPVAATFAATYPDRTEALVLSQSWARLAQGPGYPFGVTQDAHAAWLETVAERWGSEARPLFLRQLVPGRSGDDEWRLALARIQRLAASPNAAVALFRAMYQVDVRALLPAIRVPTLVLHNAGDRMVPVEHGRYLAANIPGARLVELGGADHMLAGNVEAAADLVQEFLTGRAPEPSADRRVVTVLFTDIVGSTSMVSSIGNRRWADLLEKHDRRVATEVRHHGGRVVDAAGDGVFALFNGPRQAIGCAEALREIARPLQVQLRAGLHTGEVEIRDERVFGMAVHIGARIAAAAEAGEILTSRTVKDLVAGSGIAFLDRGVHTLKGVPDEWQLFAVRSGSP